MLRILDGSLPHLNPRSTSTNPLEPAWQVLGSRLRLTIRKYGADRSGPCLHITYLPTYADSRVH